MNKILKYISIIVIIALSACHKVKNQEELYNSITTTIFKNKYDKNGKLLAVNIKELNEFNIDGKYFTKEINIINNEYNYLDNGIYKIIEINEMPYFSTIDTIYYMDGKEVQKITHHEDGRSISTLEYDEYGNITKNIRKFKSNTPVVDETLEEMLEILRNSKDK